MDNITRLAILSKFEKAKTGADLLDLLSTLSEQLAPVEG
jgi:hypothetical protein